jgi:hypothetical protein
MAINANIYFSPDHKTITDVKFTDDNGRPYVFASRSEANETVFEVLEKGARENRRLADTVTEQDLAALYRDLAEVFQAQLGTLGAR